MIQTFGICPCRVDPGSICRTEGTKIAKVSGHLVGCGCRSCLGRRSGHKGRRAQTTMHQRLGGFGTSPRHEESARVYPPVFVMPESKHGDQIPKSWDKFLATEWFRRALDQNVRAIPVGSGVTPAVVLRGRWLIADLGATRSEAPTVLDGVGEPQARPPRHAPGKRLPASPGGS